MTTPNPTARDGWHVFPLPLNCQPIDGEGLDSWLQAYARLVHTDLIDLLHHLQVSTAGRPVRTLVTQLDDQTAVRIAGGLNTTPAAVHRMTLARFDGICLRFNSAGTGLRRPPAWRRLSGSRYCPQCLEDTSGRWLLEWRLPWSFACTTHNCLLQDTCPRCSARPSSYAPRSRHVEPGHCANKAYDRSDADIVCGYDLTKALVTPIPETGALLAAQRHLRDILLAEPAPAPNARTHLGELFAVARKTLNALDAAGTAATPQIRAVIEETGAPLQPYHHATAETAWHVAVGTAVAHRLLTGGDVVTTTNDADLRWIASINTQNAFAAYAKEINRSWKDCPEHVTAYAYASVDAKLRPFDRLRYATTAPKPTVGRLDDDRAQLRAKHIPSHFWPSWTLRLLSGRIKQARTARSELSGYLLRVGTNVSTRHAAKFLGYKLARNAEDLRWDWVDSEHLTDALSTLTQLALALDREGSPIDYSRRRRIFTKNPPAIDAQAFRQICRRHGWGHSSLRLLNLNRLLFELLTGTHPRGAPYPLNFEYPDSNHQAAKWHELRSRLPVQLSELLRDQAEKHLAAHRIKEPVHWEPPRHWVTDVTYPGIEPEDVDADHYRRLVTQGATPAQMRQELDLEGEQLVLYGQLLGTQSKTIYTNPDHEWSRITPDRLRELYIEQGLTLEAMAKATGCGKQALREELIEAGIELRPAGRRRRSYLDRDWFHEQYVIRGRTLKDIGEEVGRSDRVMADYARELGITLRPRGGAPNPFAKLPPDISVSRELAAAAWSQQGLERILILSRVVGHPSLTAAGKAIGKQQSVLTSMILRVERDTGVTLFHRAVRGTPMRASEDGLKLFKEAVYLSGLLRETTASSQD
ncbi:TniQ family protein [Streptomyces griseofuscus]|uniref:TniQ family protein n=1 Tax=Streptomyces griseofuscus TaxID=146922 RepID=UPI003456878B